MFMASNENGKYMKNIENRLPISQYFNNPEYSQFQEYCANSNIFFIDELQPYDYFAFRSQYKVDNEFARIIRSKVEALKSNLPIPASSTASPAFILCNQEFESLSVHDEKVNLSWEQMVQVAADANMNAPLDDLDIPKRISNKLKSVGISTIGKLLLTKYEKLQYLGHIGPKALEIIRAVITDVVLNSVNPSMQDFNNTSTINLQNSSPLQGQEEKQTTHTLIDDAEELAKLSVIRDFSDQHIDSLELPIRAYNSLMRAGYSTIGKVFSATEEELLKIRNLGMSTIQCIQVSKKRFFEEHSGWSQSQRTKQNNLSSQVEDSIKSTQRISNSPNRQSNDKNTDNKIELLKLFGLIPKSQLCKELYPFIKLYAITYGINETALADVFSNCEKINDIQKNLSLIGTKEQQNLFKNFLEWLTSNCASKNANLIVTEINENSRVRQILARRARGETLESISQNFGVTRERIRQIESKVLQKQHIRRSLQFLLYEVSAELNRETIITFDDFQKVIADPDLLWYLLRKKKVEGIKFDKNIECFCLNSNFNPKPIYDSLFSLPKFVDDSKRENLLIGIAKKNNAPQKYVELAFAQIYSHAGNFNYQGKMNRGSMYSFIVNHYFPNGIQIYDANEMARFKKYLREEFGNINCSENDRAFWGIIQRTCILYDRGVYIHPSKVIISEELVNRIETYFVESGRTSMAYHELFDRFADELLTQANISNRYALQGVLRDRWGEKYEFFRDGISTKEGYKVTQEIESYIRSNSPVSKDMLRSTFSGITEAMLMQNIARIPSVILGDTATFIHSDQLNLTDNDYSIRNVIKTLTEDSPVTASKLLEALYHSHSDFLFRNDISTPNLLFGVLQYMFSDEFSFSRPYISSLNIENISKREVILSLLDGQESIDIADLVTLCEENHVSYQSTTLLISSMDDAFLRVDENTLISITCVPITDEKLDQIKNLLTDAIGAKGYLIIKAIDNYIFYPDLVYPWTPYLLCSIIDKYLADNFRLINNPTNRNISSDFIVDTRVGIDSYEDLVRSAIRTEHRREPFKDLANIVLWLVNEGFLAEKAVILKEDHDLFNSTSIRLVNRNIPKFITDNSFLYVDNFGNLIVQ